MAARRPRLENSPADIIIEASPVDNLLIAMIRLPPKCKTHVKDPFTKAL